MTSAVQAKDMWPYREYIPEFRNNTQFFTIFRIGRTEWLRNKYQER